MAQLQIPNELVSATYTVTAPQTVFPFTFAVFAKTDLHFSVNGTELLQTDFTLSGTLLDGGGYQGGTVTLNVAVANATCRLWRQTQVYRASNFAPSPSVPVRDIDVALNRLTAMVQDTQQGGVVDVVVGGGGGVALATSGTPADLGVAAIGVGTTAARSDHIHKQPTLATLGAADIHLSTVSVADLRTALLSAGALLLAPGVTEIALPASARASKVFSFDSSGHPTFTDPAAGGGGGVTSVNGSVGVVSVTPANIAAVPQASFRTSDFYGALNGNNATDNKTVLDLIRAATDAQVWLPGKGSDTYYTTNAITDFAGMRMRGAAKIRTSDGNNLPADFRLISTKPTVGTGSDVLYDFSGDLRHTDATYTLIGGSVRRDLDAAYFESTVTPKWHYMLNNSGGGGVDADIVAKTASDTIKVNLSYAGSTELAAGQTVAIFSGMDGSEIYRGVINVVTVAGANSLVQFTTALPTTVPAGSVLSRSKRTMAMANFVKLNHNGRGDAYAYLSRVAAAVPLANGIRHFFGGKTVANFGGDMALSADGVYGTYMEHIATGTADVAFWGWVQSFVRNVDTGDRGVGWGGIYFKSEGTKPADVGFRLTGQWRVGLDTVAADFSSNGQAVIQLAQLQRVYLDATNPTTGRGTDPGGVWPPFYSNTPGTTWFSVHPAGELDARGKRLEFVVNGALTGAGYGSFNIRGADIEAHHPFNVYDNGGTLQVNLDPATVGIYFGSDGAAGVQRNGVGLFLRAGGNSAMNIDWSGGKAVIAVPGDLTATQHSGSTTDRGGGGRVYVGANSYIDFDGTSMVFFCNGVARFAIDPTSVPGFYKL